MRLRVLSGDDVRALLPMADAIDAMRAAFSQLSSGEASLPLRTQVPLDGGVSLFMPGRLERTGAVGAKVVSVVGENRARGLPTIHAAVLVLDPESGAPEALLDGTSLTALRTGAASGLATDLLALPEAAELVLFGAGPQARTQLEAVLAVRPIRTVRVIARTRTSAARFAAWARETHDVDAQVAPEPGGAVARAHVIVTATDSREPLFPGSLVPPGAHVNAIGSFTADMREFDDELLVRATTVVDARSAAAEESGEIIAALGRGVLEVADLRELGEIVNGVRPGRSSPEEITLFKSVGSAAQDLEVAHRVVRAARARGVGTDVEL